MATYATIVAILCFGLSDTFAVQFDSRLYLPPADGPKPPSTNFNFLNLPPPQPSYPFPSSYDTPICNPPPVHQIVKQSIWHPNKKTDTIYQILDAPKNANWDLVGNSNCPDWRRRDGGNDCIAFQFNTGTTQSNYITFDGCEQRQIPIQCEQLHYERFIIRCTFPNNRTVTEYITHSDGQIYLLGYHCWTGPDGRQLPSTVGLYSIYKNIPESLRRQIVRNVGELGFDPSSIRYTDYDTCPSVPGDNAEPITSPETRPQYTKPPPRYCSPPSNVLSVDNWSHDKKDDLLYYPLVYSQNDLAKETGYVDQNLAAEQNSCDSEPFGFRRKKQCIASKFNSEAFTSQFHYYDGCEQHKLDEECAVLEPGKIAISCKLPNGGELRQYGVLGDNHTYILMYECWPHRDRKPVTWSLRSTSKRIPESLKQYILDYAQRFLGFDYHDYREVDYSQCPNF